MPVRQDPQIVQQFPTAGVFHVIGFDLPLDCCGNHGKPLSNGRHNKHYLTGNLKQIPFEELCPVEVSFHQPTYERYQRIFIDWQDLRAGIKVMCRCRLQYPEDIFNGGHGGPLSCARVSSDPVGDGWLRAKGTDQWRCPSCEFNASNGLGSVTGDL